jgi:leucyl aminopeptidase
VSTATRDGAAVNPIPSVRSSGGPAVRVVASAPADAGAIGIPVAAEGPLPSELGLDRAALAAAGFGGQVGQALVLPRQTGPTLVAVGIGGAALDAAALRDAAAAFARAAGGTHERLTVSLAGVKSVPPEVAAQAVVEGVLLARYRYDALKPQAPGIVSELVLVAGPDRVDAVKAGAERGRVLAAVASLARDLANAPAGILTATRLAEISTTIAAERGLGIEVSDKAALIALGCGGLLGVNAGSAEPPRMIKLTYKPPKATGHLALVGKGIMYDSGGINLKPTDDMHLAMKMDMSGAAAVLASMSGLAALGCKTAVTGYMMCTDNMPSGSAMKMGDVLTMRGGMTIEINNTDAEGRLVMADALVLATEEHPDAIVDIATLTGAAFRALGDQVAAVIGNNQGLVDQVQAAAQRTDEPVWQLPLDRRYRSQLDSEIAVMKNVGEAAPAAITAALFLDEFVAGIPWAHIDIAGTMRSSSDRSWRSTGATGFGARLLADLALAFTPPKAKAA